jgi:hypothetical protein
VFAWLGAAKNGTGMRWSWSEEQIGHAQSAGKSFGSVPGWIWVRGSPRSDSYSNTLQTSQRYRVMQEYHYSHVRFSIP